MLNRRNAKKCRSQISGSIAGNLLQFRTPERIDPADIKLTDTAIDSSANRHDASEGDSGISNSKDRDERESLLSVLRSIPTRCKKKKLEYVPGENLIVVSGENAGKQGKILDANYLENTILVSVEESEQSVWMNYDDVSAPT